MIAQSYLPAHVVCDSYTHGGFHAVGQLTSNQTCPHAQSGVHCYYKHIAQLMMSSDIIIIYTYMDNYGIYMQILHLFNYSGILSAFSGLARGFPRCVLVWPLLYLEK